MKKTVKTAMTSAMFAAAIGVSAGNMPVSGASQSAAVRPAEEPQTTEVTTTDLQLEGVPVVFEETTTEPDVMFDGEILPETTTTEEVVFEGVAPMPEETTTEVQLGGDVAVITGDLNYDYRVNAKDLSALKRAILEGERYQYEHDINDDGVVDKEDVKALRRMLTGKSKAEEDAEEEAQTTTTTVTDETILTELTTMTETIPAPLYGPPEYFE